MAKKLSPLLLPWSEPKIDKADVIALQQVAAGVGNAMHQKRVIDWIINYAADTYGLSFRPEEAGGERATAFAEGKRFVGLQIVKLLKIDPNIYTKE